MFIDRYAVFKIFFDIESGLKIYLPWTDPGFRPLIESKLPYFLNESLLIFNVTHKLFCTFKNQDYCISFYITFKITFHVKLSLIRNSERSHFDLYHCCLSIFVNNIMICILNDKTAMIPV